jgi:hypothetical protein
MKSQDRTCPLCGKFASWNLIKKDIIPPLYIDLTGDVEQITWRGLKVNGILVKF